MVNFKAFRIERRENDGEFVWVVYDQFGNWYDSFRTFDDVMEDITRYGHTWKVCPSCHAGSEFFIYYDDGYECALCHSEFSDPLFPASGGMEEMS